MVHNVENLTDLLDAVEKAQQEKDEVSVGDVLEKIGTRSFGALLLLPSLIALSPVGGIPTVPTLMALFVVLIAGQLLIGRDHFWLPQFITRRATKRDRVEKSLKFLRPVTNFVDKAVRHRLTAFATGPATYVIGATCILVALMMPPLEVVPFANFSTATALTLFALALIGRDGLLALAAFAITAASIGWAIYYALG